MIGRQPQLGSLPLWIEEIRDVKVYSFNKNIFTAFEKILPDFCAPDCDKAHFLLVLLSDSNVLCYIQKTMKPTIR